MQANRTKKFIVDEGEGGILYSDKNGMGKDSPEVSKLIIATVENGCLLV